MQPAIWENTVFAGYQTTSSHRYSRLSLGPDGSVVFQANFRDGDPPVTYNGIFRVNPNGGARLVAANYEPWPDLAGIPSFDGDTMAAGANDTVYFSALSGAKRGLYRQQGFNAASKIVATGDALLGSTVANFHGFTQYYSSEDGEVIFGVTLVNGQSFLVAAPAGDLSRARSQRISGWTGIYGANDNGILAMVTPFGKSYGLYLWKGEETREIYVQGRTQVDGGVTQSFLSAAMDLQGRVSALVQTDKSPVDSGPLRRARIRRQGRAQRWRRVRGRGSIGRLGTRAGRQGGYIPNDHRRQRRQRPGNGTTASNPSP